MLICVYVHSEFYLWGDSLQAHLEGQMCHAFQRRSVRLPSIYCHISKTEQDRPLITMEH